MIRTILADAAWIPVLFVWLRTVAWGFRRLWPWMVRWPSWRKDAGYSVSVGAWVILTDLSHMWVVLHAAGIVALVIAYNLGGDDDDGSSGRRVRRWLTKAREALARGVPAVRPEWSR